MVRHEDQESSDAREEIQKTKIQLDKALERVMVFQAEVETRKRLSPADHVRSPVSVTRLCAEVILFIRITCVAVVITFG